jgi:hypothetical protein
MTIENSTIYSNSATGGSGKRARGGGLINAGYTTIVNSTISGNSAAVKSGNDARGGGVMNYRYLTIDNSTITGNSAAQGGGIWNQNIGGVLHSHSFTQLVLERSIISGNQASTEPEIYSDVSNYYTTIYVDNFNLFGTDNNPGVTGFIPGTSDIIPGAGVMISNILAPLADNGGPTKTHALVPGSPAIDVAPVDGDCPADDQRGVARPQGGGCDIGAFEK